MNATAVVRDMEAADVERVAAIEAEAFTSPWKAETFRSLLDQNGAELVVLDLPEAPVVGYAIVWCVLDHGELANIAVAEDWRGRALGAFLLDRVVERARERGVTSLYLEVRDSNAVARHLYETRGFIEIGRRADYYDQPREDARVLVKHL